MSTPVIFIKHSTGHFSQTNQARKKGIQIGKEDVKLSVLADNIILYTGNPSEYTHTIIRANNFRKEAGYKINIKKSLCS